jgi:hypothetical protein
MIRNKLLFYLLSFTWGLPMTLIGCVVAIVLLMLGYKPKKWGYCYYFEVGKNWGGIELGLIFIVNQNALSSIKSHELGHSQQNCMLGFLMPFLVCIPSATRYWYREYLVRSGKKKYFELPDYDSVWFESQASTLGTKFIKWYNTTK